METAAATTSNEKGNGVCSQDYPLWLQKNSQSLFRKWAK